MLKLEIQYFALLREQRGVSREMLATTAATPETLYGELREKYLFSLPVDRIRAAVNGEFVPANVALKDGDTIVFIPPVAGG